MKRTTFRLVTAALLVIGTALSAAARDYVSVSANITEGSFEPSAEVTVAIDLTVKDGLHMNAHKPLEDFLIPTVIEFSLPAGVTLKNISYPEPELAQFSFSENEMAVYAHTVTATAVFAVNSLYAPEDGPPRGTVRYQACSDISCFAPATAPFTIGPAAVSPAPADVPQAGSAESTEVTRAQNVLAKGMLYAILAFFLFGLALNLTPCVYPVIPITISFFARQGESSKGSQVTLASFYVLGIALVFAVLGLVSAAAGSQWGFLFQNVWFVIGIAMVMLAMAASMFGAFEIALPQRFMSAGNAARSGYLGSLIMGLTVGAIIAPCASGIIIGLVTLVAQTGMVIRGTLLFFVMGLGLGVPYLFLAAFSGTMGKLPKSGMWMIWIKKVFGVILVGLAFYFLAPQLKHVYDLKNVLLGITTLFGGLYLGFLDHAPGYSGTFKLFRTVLGTALMLLGIFVIRSGLHESAGPKINWVRYDGAAAEKLIGSGQPVLLDFYADWCAPCKKMDAETFSDIDVINATRAFTCIKIDCTKPDKATAAFMQKYGVTGVPSYIFLSPLGMELKHLRSIGFEPPAAFLKRLHQASH